MKEEVNSPNVCRLLWSSGLKMQPMPTVIFKVSFGLGSDLDLAGQCSIFLSQNVPTSYYDLFVPLDRNLHARKRPC